MISELEYKKIESYFLEYGYRECKNFNLRQNMNISLISKNEFESLDKMLNEFLSSVGTSKIYNQNMVKLNVADTILLREKILNNLLENEINFGLKQFVDFNSGFYLKNDNFISNFNCLKTFNIYNPIIYTYLLERNVELINNDNNKCIPYNINDNSNIILEENNFNKESRTVYSLLNIASLYGKRTLIKILEELYEISSKGSTIILDYYTNEVNDKSLLEDVILFDHKDNVYDFNEMEEILSDIGFIIYEHMDYIEFKNKFYDIGELDKDVSKNYKLIIATKYN